MTRIMNKKIFIIIQKFIVSHFIVKNIPESTVSLVREDIYNFRISFGYKDFTLFPQNFTFNLSKLTRKNYKSLKIRICFWKF